MRRALGYFFLFLLAALPALAQEPPSAESIRSLEAEATERRRELESLRELLDQERRRLEKVEKREDSVLDLLEQADLALARYEGERLRLEGQIATLEKAAAQTKKDLAAEKARLERQRKSLTKRLVGLYKLGPAGSVRVLLSAASVADFQRRRHHLGVILAEDAERVKIFQESIRKLESLEVELKAQLGQLEERRSELLVVREKAVIERKNRLRIVQAVQRQREKYEEAVGELSVQSEALQQLLDLLERKIRSQLLLQTPKGIAGPRFVEYQKSLAPPVQGALLSRFGRQVNEHFGTITFNNGVELSAKAGTPVQAVFGGVVLFADRFRGYGNLLILDHGEGFYTLYAHCGALKKSVGDPVETREVIATVGESGLQQEPSLYFEVRHHGRALDPAEWLLLE